MLISQITVNATSNQPSNDKTIYLSTNGVHLDVIIAKNDVSPDLLSGLEHIEHSNYLSFGWGDENFYLNTPTWGDLTLENGFRALFLKSSSLIHLTRYTQPQEDWVPVKLSANELRKLNTYIQQSFHLNNQQQKIFLENKGYSKNDDFYKANGSYSLFYTCNSWVNHGFKTSGIKASYWTPFDFNLLNLHKQ